MLLFNKECEDLSFDDPLCGIIEQLNQIPRELLFAFGCRVPTDYIGELSLANLHFLPGNAEGRVAYAEYLCKANKKVF